MGCSNSSTLEDNKIEQILYTVAYNNEISICFLCQIEIPDSNNILPVLFIVKNIFKDIDDYTNMTLTLKSKYNNKESYTLLIGDNRIVFSNDYGTIIEIKKNDGIHIEEYPTLNSNESYSNSIFYLINIPKEKTIDKIQLKSIISYNNEQLQYDLKKTNIFIPYGCPIIDFNKNIIVGYHKQVNYGIKINNILYYFNEEQKEKLLIKNGQIINIHYYLNYFDDEIRLFGKQFIENNKENCKRLNNNNSIDELEEFENVSILSKIMLLDYKIKIIILKPLINLSHMFDDCKNLYKVPDIDTLNTSQVNDMSFMFSGCDILESLPDISKWDTSNVTTLKGIFFVVKD